MLHQWDQRPYTDARQVGRVRAESDRRLGKIRRRDPNRPSPSVRQRDNDVGGTAPGPFLEQLKPVPKQKMMRVDDRDVRHDPFQNRGTLSCSASPLSAMRYWIRIVHNAYRLELDGPSMRKIKAAEAIEPPAQSATPTAADGKSSKGAKK